MSHNTTVELEIKDVKLLKKALVDALGLLETDIEVHANPVRIQDYYKKKFTDVHVVVRKEALRRAKLGGMADAGFFVSKGVAQFHHDDMDVALPKKYGQIKAHYAKHTAIEAAKKAGRNIEERIENGKLVLKVTR